MLIGVKPDYSHPPAQIAYVGKWPAKGPQGEDLDECRRKKAGTSLSERFAVVEFRGDWMFGPI